MKYLFSILLIFTLTNVFGQINQRDIIVLSLDSTSKIYMVNDVNVKIVPLSKEEIELAKKEARKQFYSVNKKQKGLRKIKYAFEDYTKQYVCYIDNLGNKVIYINALCHNIENLEDFNHRLYLSLDGGNCYFQMSLDSKTKKCLKFTFNGIA
jgi:hypothetical protein